MTTARERAREILRDPTVLRSLAIMPWKAPRFFQMSQEEKLQRMTLDIEVRRAECRLLGRAPVFVFPAEFALI